MQACTRTAAVTMCARAAMSVPQRKATKSRRVRRSGRPLREANEQPTRQQTRAQSVSGGVGSDE